MIPLGILASSIRVALSDALLAPTNLAASLAGGLVKLTWTDRNANETGHRVYRSSSPMDTQALPPPEAELGPNVTEWEDTDTPADQVTYYIVSAVRGDDEAFSDEVMIDTTPTEEDPYWDNVVALLHFDGDLRDETGREWSVLDSPPAIFNRISPISGEASFISGTTVLQASSDGAHLGGGDFTIEVMVTVSSFQTGTDQSGIVVARDSSSSISWMLGTQPNKTVRFAISSTGSPSGWVTMASGTTLNLDQEYHLASSRSGSKIRLFIDGVLEAEADVGSLVAYSGVSYLTIGVADRSEAHLARVKHKGLIDELRITKGVARYTENFDPPTAPFPNVGPPL